MDYQLTEPYRPKPLHAVAGAPSGGYLAVTEALVSDGEVNLFLTRYDTRGNTVSALDLGIRERDVSASGFTDDGRLVISRYGLVGNEFGVIVERRLATGALDMSFSSDGRVGLVHPGHRLVPSVLSIDDAGFVTLGGYAHPTSNNTAPAAVLFMAQVGPDGAVAGAFGAGGVALYDLLPNAYEFPDDILRTPDGAVLVCATGSFGGQLDAIVARFTPSGGLDDVYGSAGIVYYDTSTAQDGNRHDYCKALEAQPGTGGVHMAVVTDFPARAQLIRLSSTGNTFPLSDLVALTQSAYAPVALEFDAHGRALLMAAETGAAGLSFIIARYLASGLRDTTFGAGGARRHEVPFAAGTNANTARTIFGRLALDKRARILLAAEVEQTSSSFGGWSAVQLQGDVPFVDGFED